jgi:hypothetical protein
VVSVETTMVSAVAITTLEVTPRPNTRMMSGASASFGIDSKQMM